jgi:hypothetical protein
VTSILDPDQPAVVGSHAMPTWDPGRVASASAQLASRYLASVGSRLPHSATVALRARRAAESMRLPAECIARLESAGWLHDIGYAPEIIRTGFHPLDGARWLRASGLQREVCSLVAWHTGSIFEAQLRSLEADLRTEHDAPPTEYLDVLTWADLTSAPDGRTCSVRERIDEILARYGDSSLVHLAVTRSRTALEAAAYRIESRLGSEYDELPHRAWP